MNENGWLSTKVETGMMEVRKSFLSLTGTIGLVAAALPPALMFMFATVNALKDDIGATAAWAVGIALGLALESAGVKISHVALDYFRLWREGDRDAGYLSAISWILTFLYLGSGAFAIYHFDSDATIRLAGYLSYLVAAIMYIASGLELLKDSRTNGAVAKLHKIINQLQDEARALQERYKESQNDNIALQTKNKDLQSQIKSQQDIIKAWQTINEENQALIRYNAKQITAVQAASILGVKDTRTVISRAEKLNGVSKQN